MPAWLRRIVYSPGVRQWGIPVAVSSTIWQAGHERGLHWTTFVSASFGLRLLSALLITGVLGGLCFEWMMKKAFGWLFGAQR